MYAMRYGLMVFLLLACVAPARAGEMEEDDPEQAVEPGQAGVPPPLPEGAIVQSGPSGNTSRLAVSPDGARIAAAGKDGKVRIYEMTGAKLLTTIPAHAGACNDVKFTWDGKHVVSCGSDALVKEWDAENGKETRQFESHGADVRSVVCSQDGLRMASSDAAATIRVWDMKSGKLVHAMTGHKVVLPPGVQGEHVATVDTLAISPDGRIVLSEADDETARLWDALRGCELRVLPKHDGSVAALALSPDGALGVSTRGSQLCPYGSAMRIWEVATGNTRRVLLGHSADITCVAFSPDGRYVFSGARDRTVRQWEVDSGLEIRRFKLTSQAVSVGYAPNGARAFSISAREGLVVWNVAAPPLGGDVRARSLDEAWDALANRGYEQRAGAFAGLLKDPPENIAREIAARFNASPADKDAQQRYGQLVAALDDDNYAVRVKAFEELQRLGPDPRGELALAVEHPSAEVRVRAAELLSAIGGGVDGRKMLVLEFLAALNSPPAREELNKIAQSHSAPYSMHAAALLARLEQAKQER